MERNGYWYCFWPRRLSRRGVLRGAALGGAGLAAAAVVGCAQEEKPKAAPAAAPAAKQPKRGGTLRWFIHRGTDVFGQSLDPHVTARIDAGRLSLFYQSLLRADPRTHQPQPEIAQRWEIASPTQIVFTLNRGVKFHNRPPANGRDLTAEDVAFSLNRFRTNDPRFINRSVLASIEEVEAIDKYTLKVVTTEPDVTVLSGLAAPNAAIYAPEVVEKAGIRFAKVEQAVGTGPFILQEMDAAAAKVVRNQDYWKPGLPYLDAVSLPAFPDPKTRWAAFLAGQLDIEYPPGTEAQPYKAERGRFQFKDKFAAEWSANLTSFGLYTNIQKPPFNDLRIPRALRLFLDHDEIVKTWAEPIRGRGRLTFILGAAEDDWNFSEEEYKARFLDWKQPKDEAVKRALDLLSAAGFTKEAPLKFELTVFRSPTVAILNELVAAQILRPSQGIVQPQLKVVEAAIINTAFARGQFEVGITGTNPATVDPDAHLRNIFHIGGGRNFGKWNDSTFNRMLDKQRQLFDVAQRKAAIKEMLVYLIDRAPYTTAPSTYSLSVAAPRVQDWAPEEDAMGFGYHYENVWLDI